jgi:hypothetical protein
MNPLLGQAVRIACCCLMAFSLQGCLFLEGIFFKPKKQNCPRYLDSWNSDSKKNKRRKIISDDPLEGKVISQTGDSASLQIIRVPRDQYGLVSKKGLKKHKNKHDPRTGYKPVHTPIKKEILH